MPRIKPEHVPYRLSDGTIRIGGRLFGIAAEIKDPGAWVWALIQTADGTRDLDAVITEVHGDFPDVPKVDLRHTLNQLAAAGHVEDVASSVATAFSAQERERYRRSVEFYRWVDLSARLSPWEVQGSLKNARVVQVGLGGTGGVAAAALVASGVGQLHCVDPDVVELSNLNRQTLYTEDDVGKPKVDAGLARLRRLNSDVMITAERRRVESDADCADLIDGYDLLVLAADRPPGIHAVVNRACLAAGTPWIDGGYHGALITAAGYVPGVGPCLECAEADERDRLRRAAAAGTDVEDPLPQVGHAVIAASAGLGGHLLAYLATTMLTGVLPFCPGARLGINLMAPHEPVLAEVRRRPDCPACTGIPATTRLPAPVHGRAITRGHRLSGETP